MRCAFLALLACVEGFQLPRRSHALHTRSLKIAAAAVRVRRRIIGNGVHGVEVLLDAHGPPQLVIINIGPVPRGAVAHNHSIVLIVARPPREVGLAAVVL